VRCPDNDLRGAEAYSEHYSITITPKPQVVPIVISAQEEMKATWRTLKSFRTTMSASRVLWQTLSQLPVKALSSTFHIPHFDYVDDYVKLMTLWMSWTS
jgi:phenylalanine-4-hydroxylase